MREVGREGSVRALYRKEGIYYNEKKEREVEGKECSDKRYSHLLKYMNKESYIVIKG